MRGGRAATGPGSRAWMEATPWAQARLSAKTQPQDFGQAAFVDQPIGFRWFEPSPVALAFFRPVIELLFDPEQEDRHLTEDVAIGGEPLAVVVVPDRALADDRSAEASLLERFLGRD